MNPASLARGRIDAMVTDDPVAGSKGDQEPTADDASLANSPATSPSATPGVPPSTASPATGDTGGAYRVWPADSNGDPWDYAKDKAPNPSAIEAVDIYFGLRRLGGPPTKDQNDLQAAISQVLGTIRALYLKDGVQKPPFRLFYSRLFRLAQLGLEGNPMPDLAKASLAQVIDDLINAEGARVKNTHLIKLGSRALVLGLIFGVLYVVLCFAPPSNLLSSLKIDPVVARSFMLLWMGCFGGVWLSYAIRTSSFTLRDLIVADDDRLLPTTRLIFAGGLTMVLGLLLALGFIDARVGGESLAAFAVQPTKALLLGLFCGVSEHLLPSMIGKRANDLLSKFL